MKSLIKLYLLPVAVCLFSATLVACSDDDDEKKDGQLTANEQTISLIAEQYVKQVVYPTYKSLADQTELLAEQLDDAEENYKKGTLTDTQLKAIGETFLKARAYWEASEAFLYGPATTFGIDPHIDTWPLDVDALARGLSNKAMLARIDEFGAADLAPTLLGFHAIEFVLFRNGQLRTVAQLQAGETDEAFASVSISGGEELLYAAAVAEDLKEKCFQLQVAWMGSAAGDRVEDVEEDWELETQIIPGVYYGENMLAAGKAGSSFKAWQDVLVTILDAGCANIAQEVANTKIGNAWNAQVYDYIESPYSKKSFVDFYDNILSIKNSLYGGIDLKEPATNSVMSFMQKANAAQASALETKLQAALQALQTCLDGPAFVDIVGTLQAKTATQATYPQVKAAVTAINDLDDELSTAASWAARVE